METIWDKGEKKETRSLELARVNREIFRRSRTEERKKKDGEL
jgi:hypothetical protein